MVRVCTTSLLLLVFGATGTRAQTLQGAVLAQGTRLPVPAVAIEITRADGGGARTTQTDSLGAFRFTDTRPGTYTLRTRHPFHAETVDTVAVRREETVVVELLLVPVAIPLQPLTVVARIRDAYGGFHARAQRGGFGYFLERERVQVYRGGRVTHLLAEVPGVELLRSGRSTLVTTRGGPTGRCVPLVFVDGMPMRQLEGSGPDEWLRPELIEGVEVYTSTAGVPPQFASFNACGAIVLWTRADSRGRWSWWKIAGGVAGLLLVLALTWP